jgi:hypothetical protein
MVLYFARGVWYPARWIMVLIDAARYRQYCTAEARTRCENGMLASKQRKEWAGAVLRRKVMRE